jgi:hypothetical protein
MNIFDALVDYLLVERSAEKIPHCGEHIHQFDWISIMLAFERRFWMSDEQRNPVVL